MARHLLEDSRLVQMPDTYLRDYLPTLHMEESWSWKHESAFLSSSEMSTSPSSSKQQESSGVEIGLWGRRKPW